MADWGAFLLLCFRKLDASRPDWPDRDRFVLSAGHGAIMLHPLPHLTGTPGCGIIVLKTLRQPDQVEAGLPWHGEPHIPRAPERAGPQDVAPIGLEHAAVAWAVMKGLHVEVAAECLDTSPETIRKHHSHSSPKDQARALEVAEKR